MLTNNVIYRNRKVVLLSNVGLVLLYLSLFNFGLTLYNFRVIMSLDKN